MKDLLLGKMFFLIVSTAFLFGALWFSHQAERSLGHSEVLIQVSDTIQLKDVIAIMDICSELGLDDQKVSGPGINHYEYSVLGYKMPGLPPGIE